MAQFSLSTRKALMGYRYYTDFIIKCLYNTGLFRVTGMTSVGYGGHKNKQKSSYTRKV